MQNNDEYMNKRMHKGLGIIFESVFRLREKIKGKLKRIGKDSDNMEFFLKRKTTLWYYLFKLDII